MLHLRVDEVVGGQQLTGGLQRHIPLLRRHCRPKEQVPQLQFEPVVWPQGFAVVRQHCLWNDALPCSAAALLVLKLARHTADADMAKPAQGTTESSSLSRLVHQRQQSFVVTCSAEAADAGWSSARRCSAASMTR